MLCQIEYILSTIILCAKWNFTYCSNVCKKMLLLLMIKQTGIPSIFSKNKNIYLDTSYKKRKIGKRHYVKLIEMYLFSLDIVLIYQAPLENQTIQCPYECSWFYYLLSFYEGYDIKFIEKFYCVRVPKEKIRGNV